MTIKANKKNISVSLTSAMIDKVKQNSKLKTGLWLTAAAATYLSIDTLFSSIGSVEMAATKLSAITLMGLIFIGSTSYLLENNS